jgi:hypothetical protein
MTDGGEGATPPPMLKPPPMLNWADSKTIGGVSEIAVLAPERLGCAPGERRTYEECVAFAIQNLADRHRQGLPTELGRIPAIHFGRMMIIRPEQYLLYSDLRDVKYYDSESTKDSESERANESDSDCNDDADHDPDNDSQAENANDVGSESGSDDATKLTDDPDCDNTDDQDAHCTKDQKGARTKANFLRIPQPIDDYERGQRPQPILRSFLLTLVEFDGELKAYMHDVAEFLARDFDIIFQNCEDFPGTANFERFWLWIRRYQINTNLFYAPYSNLSTVRIKQLEDFKRRFDALVARIYSPAGTRVRSVDALFEEFLRESRQYASNFPTPGGIFETNES